MTTTPRPTPLTDALHGISQYAHTTFERDLIEHARQLERDRAELMEILEACADDLADELEGRYASTKHHSAIKGRYERDMKLPNAARTLLKRLETK